MLEERQKRFNKKSCTKQEKVYWSSRNVWRIWCRKYKQKKRCRRRVGILVKAMKVNKLLLLCKHHQKKKKALKSDNIFFSGKGPPPQKNPQNKTNFQLNNAFIPDNVLLILTALKLNYSLLIILENLFAFYRHGCH